ncbi:MAG: AI-2E family transporter [Propionicimonas sp.]|nr:AI-2E family transporter [Propionicimonas sp.]
MNNLSATPQRAPRHRLLVNLGHPFRWGFMAAAGALVAYALAMVLGSLTTVLVSLGVAVFLALALDPLVRWLERRGLSRGLAIGIVFAGFAVVFGGLIAIVLPTAIDQVVGFAQAVPGWIEGIQQSDWFNNLLALMGTEDAVSRVIDEVRSYISNPDNLLALGGGALAVGSGVASGLTGVGMTFILTLYFLATLRSIRSGLGRLLPAYSRPVLGEVADQIVVSVGSYVMGMLILAACNAVFAFILLTVLGVDFAVLLAVLALFITMIPMIGSVLFLIIAGVVALLGSPVTGLIFVVAYFGYMQIEAYIMSPRLMNRQVSVPGSLSIIAAMVGAALLGLLGALVAVPVAAAVLLVLQRFVIPQQNARTEAPRDSGFDWTRKAEGSDEPGAGTEADDVAVVTGEAAGPGE